MNRRVVTKINEEANKITKSEKEVASYLFMPISEGLKYFPNSVDISEEEFKSGKPGLVYLNNKTDKIEFHKK
jgi:hypothetical protein